MGWFTFNSMVRGKDDIGVPVTASVGFAAAGRWHERRHPRP